MADERPKPWEETWHYDHNDETIATADGEYVANTELGESSGARAKLAAAAPEMARLLLEMVPLVEMDDVCPTCCCRTEHAADCRLVLVLLKAGALP
jgi:hypothetical protein